MPSKTPAESDVVHSPFSENAGESGFPVHIATLGALVPSVYDPSHDLVFEDEHRSPSRDDGDYDRESEPSTREQIRGPSPEPADRHRAPDDLYEQP